MKPPIRYVPHMLLLTGLTLGAFILGRMTHQSAVPDSGQETATANATPTQFHSRHDSLKGLSASPAWSSSGISIPQEGYTLESFKETARRLNLIRGYRPARLLELSAVQQALGRQDVHALIDQLHMDPSPETPNAMYLAFGVYTEKAPVEALDYLLADFSHKNLRGSRKMVIAANMEINPQQTLAKLQQMPDDQERSRAIQYAIAALAGKDPARAFEMTQEYGLKDGRYESASTLFSEWGRQDPQAAAAVINQIADTKTREEAVENLLWTWGRQDPAAAWKWALENPGGASSSQDTRSRTLHAWANVDAVAALNAALSLEDASIRQASIPYIVNEWAEDDQDAALDWLGQQEDAKLMSDVLQRLSYRDGISHARLFQVMNENMPAGQSYQHTVRNLMYRWADSDPAGAASAIAGLPPSEVRANGIHEVAYRWASSDPAAAMEWVQQLPRGNTYESARNSALRQIAQSDPDLAKSYYWKLSQSEQSDAASQIASGMARRDPQQALQFAGSISDENARNNAQESIGRQWGRNDPEQAARWAKTLQGEVRQTVISGLVDSWASQNTEAAAEWLSQFPPEPGLDRATRNLARHLSAENPEAALSWAQSITDENMRRSTLHQTIYQWKRYDADAANQWVMQSDLTDQQKEQFLRN
ncbi:MAG: hypothetical protein AAF571_07205 [Verrucomicrobiota bacterium]